jgi:hypothetical protein
VAIAPFLLLARIATNPKKLTLADVEALLTSEFGGSDAISLRRIRRSLLAARSDDDLRTGSAMLIDALIDGDIPIEDAPELNRVHTLLSLARKSLARKNPTVHDLLWAIWSNAVTSDGSKVSDAWRDAALRGGSRGAAADRDLDAMIVLFDSAARFIERFPGAAPPVMEIICPIENCRRSPHPHFLKMNDASFMLLQPAQHRSCWSRQRRAKMMNHRFSFMKYMKKYTVLRPIRPRRRRRNLPGHLPHLRWWQPCVAI